MSTVAALAASAGPGIAAASETELATVPGVIVDATPDRVLYRPADGLDPLRLRVVATGPPDITMPAGSGRKVGSAYARLFDGGVLFDSVGSSPTSHELYEWRTGDAAATSLGSYSSASLDVGGNFAIWNLGSGSTNILMRRDLTLKVNLVVAIDAGNTENDVATNGDIVYWDRNAPLEVFRWRNGVATKVSNVPAPDWATYPRTDGNLVVYRRTPDACCDGEQSIHFSDGTIAAKLPGSDTSINFAPQVDTDYAVNHGWIAYTGSSRAKVWTRSPAGVVAEAGTDGPGGFREIAGLAPTGQVAYNRSSTAFLGAPGRRPFPLGARVDAFSSGARWYLIRGGVLSRLDTDTALTATPPTATPASTATFAVAATARDPIFECKLDGVIVGCPSGDYTTDGLSEGTHTFTAGSTDPALNEQDPTPASWTWTVDHTPPSDFALLSPPDGGGVRQVPELSWNPSDDPGGSGIARYEVRVNGKLFGTTGPATTSFTPGPPDNATIGNGTHTWNVTAVDAAGNTRQSATRTFIFDTIEPTPPAPLAPADGARVGPRPTLSWSASSDSGSGVAGYDVEIDGVATRVGAGVTSFTPASDLAKGDHSWRVIAIDGAGNRAAGPTRSFDVVPGRR